MLEIKRNLYVIRRWWWLLTLATLVGGLVAFTLTHVLTHPTYRATSIIAEAPGAEGPNGSYVNRLLASADAQLIPTMGTADQAARSVPGVDASTLATHIESVASVDNQLIFVSVTWPELTLAMTLANQVARAFVVQERQRLARRYGIVHASLVAQERHLSSLMTATSASGQAGNWLRAQYADTAAKIYQQDADARIQTVSQQDALQIAQPATTAAKLGAKASVNAALGAGLALLLAFVLALAATSSYGEPDAEIDRRPKLTSVGE